MSGNALFPSQGKLFFLALTLLCFSQQANASAPQQITGLAAKQDELPRSLQEREDVTLPKDISPLPQAEDSGFSLEALSASIARITGKANKETDHLEKVPVASSVVTATRREMPLDKVTRFVTVIDRDEIVRSGYLFVIDLLRSTPGVTITQSGPMGRTSTVFIRGGNANHTLILMDGVQINSPTTGQANLQHITTGNIERIEILRGAQSVLYGADALSGVINIVTKSKIDRSLETSGQFEFGTHETFYESGTFSGASDRFSFSAYADRLDSGGPGQNDAYENTTARVRGTFQATENSELDVAFNFYNGLIGIEDGAFRQDPNRSNKSREQVLNTKYTVLLTDWWEQYVEYSFFHDVLVDFDPINPGSTGTDPETDFKINTGRHTFEYQSIFNVSDFDVLTVGYEFEHTQSNINQSTASGGFEELLRNHGLFFQNELTLWKIWTVVAGVRIDENNFYGIEANPLVSSSIWIEKTQTKLKGSFGRAFKAPTLNELAFPGFGNPGVQPERSWSWDAGIEQFYWDEKSQLSVTYFHNSVDNLIQFVFSGGSFKAENVAEATMQGIEIAHEITPWEYVTFSMAYTYTDAIDEATGKRLARRPWHQGRVGVDASFGRLHANANWVMAGDRNDTLNGRRVINEGYTRLDIALYYDLTKHMQVYGRAENITNGAYDEVLGFDNPGARFMTGIKVLV